VAGESTHVGFTTDIDQVVAKVTSGLQRMAGEVRSASGQMDSAQFGGDFLANYRKGLQEVGRLANEVAAKAKSSTESALRASSSSRAFVQPAGGAYNTQLNTAMSESVRGIEQMLKAASSEAPALKQVLIAETRAFVTDLVGGLRAAATTGGAELRALTAERRAAGANIPIRAAISGNGLQNAALDRRVDQAFPQQGAIAMADVNRVYAQLGEQATAQLRSARDLAGSSAALASLEQQQVALSREQLLARRAALEESKVREARVASLFENPTITERPVGPRFQDRIETGTALYRFPVNEGIRQRAADQAGYLASPFSVAHENEPPLSLNARAQRAEALSRFGTDTPTGSQSQVAADMARQSQYASQKADQLLAEIRAGEQALVEEAAAQVARAEITENLRKLARTIQSENLQGFVGMREVSESLQNFARTIDEEAARTRAAATGEAEQAAALARNLRGTEAVGPAPTSLPPILSPTELAAQQEAASNARALAHNLGSPLPFGTDAGRAPELADADRQLARAEAEQAAALARNLHGTEARGGVPTSLPPAYNPAQAQALQDAILKRNLSTPFELPPAPQAPPAPTALELQATNLANAQQRLAAELESRTAGERESAAMTQKLLAASRSEYDERMAAREARLVHGPGLSSEPIPPDGRQRDFDMGDIYTQHYTDLDRASGGEGNPEHGANEASILALQRNATLRQLASTNRVQDRVSDEREREARAIQASIKRREDADEREARAINKSIDVRSQADNLLMLQAREAAGTAERFGGSYRTNEGDYYTSSMAGKGQRPVTDSGEIAEQERRYGNVIQSRGMAEARMLSQAETIDARLQTAKEEEANAHRIAAQLESGEARRIGGLFDTPQGIYKQTANYGARAVTSPLELQQAQSQLAKVYDSEAKALARTQPRSFFQGFGSGITSRSAFGNNAAGGGQTGLNLAAIPGNIGQRLGSLAESTIGFAAFGLAIKAVSDTKKETLDYIDSLTNLEVRMQRTGSVTAEFTNQLEGLSRLAGSNVGAELDAAARSVAAFGDTSTMTTADLRKVGAEGATAASQLSVIAGTDLPTASNNLIAVASSFGLAGDQLGQVNDAIANAKDLGGDAADIASGLAGVAGAAQEAGFNLQQTADLVSLVTARTNESGEAAATRLTALFSLFGSHQSTLTGLGVDVTAPLREQIDQLAGIFPKLSNAQQKATLSQLGGRTALRELIPVLTNNIELQKTYAASLGESGAGLDEFNRKNGDLAGLFRKIGGDITNIQVNLVRSGVFDGLGAALKVLEPALKTLSDLLGLIDRFGDSLGPLKALGGTLLDVWVALKLLKSIGILPNFYANLPGLRGAGGPAVPQVIQRRLPGRAGANAVEEESTAVGASDAATTNADTTATTRNTAAKTANAKATNTAANASRTDATAKSGEAQATDAATVAHEGSEAAILNEIAALNEMSAIDQEILKLEGDRALSIDTLVTALDTETAALDAINVLNARYITNLETTTAAEYAAARASLARGEALRVEGAAEVGEAQFGKINPLMQQRTLGEARGAIASGARSAGGFAASALGGPIGIGITAAIMADQLFSAVKGAADRMKSSMDQLASAMDEVNQAANPDDMHKAADSLRAAADARAKSTSGFFGSIGGFIVEHIPIVGRSSNADAASGRAAATDEDNRANLLDKIERHQANAGSGAVFGNAPFTIDAITAGFTKLDAAGLGAGKQIDALVAALSGVGTGVGTLLPGGGMALGVSLSNTYEDTMITALAHGVKVRHPDASDQDAQGSANAYVKDISDFSDPKKAQEIRGKVQDTVTKFIHDQGLDDGGVLSPEQMDQLADKLADLWVPKEAGKKERAATKAKAKALILDQLKNDTDPSKLIVDQTTADAVQQMLVQKAQTDAQQVQSTTGDPVQAAQKRLDDIRKAEKLVQDKGRTVDDTTKVAEADAQRQLAEAISARADSTDALAKATNGQDLVIANAFIDLQTAQRHLAEAIKDGDPKKIKDAQAEVANANAAIAKDVVDQSNSLTDLKANPDSQLSQDQAALTDAKRTLSKTHRWDANGQQTKAYNDNLKAVQTAQAKVNQDRVDQANAIADATISSQDPTGQAKLTYTQAVDQLKRLEKRHAGKTEIATQQKVVNDAYNAYLQSQADDANSAAATGVDNRDPVANAKLAVQQAVTNLNTLIAQGAKGKPLDDARKQLADAQHNELQAEIAAANEDAESRVALGDQLGVARQAYLSLLNTARGQIGSQREATLRQAATAKTAYLKLKADIGHGQRTGALDPRDATGLANENLRYDNELLKIPGQDTEALQQERQQRVADRLAKQQADIARDVAHRSEAARTGDPLAAAAADLSNARETLKGDLPGQQKYFDDLKALHAAEAAYATAAEQHANVLLQLAGDTTDPVEQARTALALATSKLADDQRAKRGDLAADQLDKETKAQALQKAQFDQNLANQQSAYQLHEETADQYLTFLKSQDSSIRKQLAGMKKGQEGYQQLVDELNTIDGAIQGLNDQLEGQFNLGDIKLPTVYEVRRAAAQGAIANTAASANSIVNNAITINGADMQAVISYLTSVLGKSSMTVATTGRKAAA
jgi:hypothetical protein